MAKPWKEMDRGELLDEKARWEANLQKTNHALSVMRRKVAQGAGYAAPADYEAAMADRLRFATGLRGVTTQLSKVNATMRRDNYEVAFRQVAKLILEADLFQEIHEAAQELVRNTLTEGGAQ